MTATATAKKTKLTFKAWMDEVNRKVIAKCGLSASDLDDCTYKDWYSEGKSPAAAASKALKNSGY